MIYMVDMATQTLGQLITEEMKRRNIKSARKFAEFAGINHRVIGDFLNEKGVDPELSTLVKLSNATGISLVTLLSLAFPEATKVDLDIDARLDAEKISQMPPNKRAIARGYIADAYAKGNDD